MTLACYLDANVLGTYMGSLGGHPDGLPTQRLVIFGVAFV
jgi:hypothetical protein